MSNKKSINFGNIKNNKKEQIEKVKKQLINNKELLKEYSSFNKMYKKRAQNLPKRIELIINWYEKNIEVDPNIYEYIEVAGDANRYLSEKKAKYKDLEKVYNGIIKLGKIVSDRTINNNIATKNSSLYGMINDATEHAISGEIMYNVTPFINKKIAGTQEYLSKLQRDDLDDNISEEEFNNLQFLIKLGLITELGVNLNRKNTFNSIKEYYEHQRLVKSAIAKIKRKRTS